MTRILPDLTPARTAAARADLAVVSDLSIVPQSTPASRRVMALLAAGVPLSLLCDLADPTGPASVDIVFSEPDSRSVLSDLLGFRAHTRSRHGGRTGAPSTPRRPGLAG